MERVKGIESASQAWEAQFNQSEFALWTARRFQPAASAAFAGDLVFGTMFEQFLRGRRLGSPKRLQQMPMERVHAEHSLGRRRSVAQRKPRRSGREEISLSPAKKSKG
jgi:hypothetical protein